MTKPKNHVQQLAHSVFAINGRLVSAGNHLVSHVGLTSALWQVLAALHYSTESLPSASIARNMGLTRQGVQRVLDLLEEKKMIEFTENPHHRRAKLVTITPKGRKAVITAEKAVAPLDQEILRKVGAKRLYEAIQTLSDVSALITHHLNEEAEENL